jgi:phosphate transport system substrate-binding protein
VRTLVSAVGSAAAALALAVGCGQPSPAPSPSRPASGSMTIDGAGATFPYPIYARWADAYAEETGARFNYQSIGSGGGIAQIKAQTVDLGASDAPLREEELDRLGLVQWPQIMGGVVPVVHLDGIAANQLRLTPGLLAGIFLGGVKALDDPGIARINPGLALPAREIGVVHRADASGSTWIFTNYLDKVSAAWHAKVVSGMAISWPVGAGGKGNEGVAALVQRIPGAIGYVEFAYALQNGMATVVLENSSGAFVEPSLATFQAAAANADWASAPGFYVVLTDQPGAESWPITGASFILFHKDQSDLEKAREALAFFAWAYAHGDQMAVALGYVPMPDTVVKMVERMWAAEITAGGRRVWTE